MLRERGLFSHSCMFRTGDLFTTTLDWKVCTVNCIGIMRKGIALEFKKRYPEMYQAYKDICDGGLLKPGMLWPWREDKILCFATKDHWRSPSSMAWIEDGLSRFSGNYQRLGITSVAFPLLGCWNGGLSESQVLPMMINCLERCQGLEWEIWKLL